MSDLFEKRRITSSPFSLRASFQLTLVQMQPATFGIGTGGNAYGGQVYISALHRVYRALRIS